jgi:hypothetical protein
MDLETILSNGARNVGWYKSLQKYYGRESASARILVSISPGVIGFKKYCIHRENG